MRVLLVGGTGFVGCEVVPLLAAQGHQVRCFLRPTSNRGLLPSVPLEVVCGDLRDGGSLEQAAKGSDAVVHITNLLWSNMEEVTTVYSRSGIARAVFISTTAIYTSIHPENRKARLGAESSIIRMGADFTILRPTMIYGNARDRNMCRLIRYLRRWTLIPVFGNGEALQQPVYVGDVAAAVVRCLDSPQTRNKAYNIPGAKALTYNEVLDTVAEALGRGVRKLHFPTKPAVAFLAGLERWGVSTPIKAAQLVRLNENKVFDYSEAQRDFDYRPLGFADGIRLQLRRMGFASGRAG